MSDEREKKLQRMIANYAPVLSVNDQQEIQSELPLELPEAILIARREICQRISKVQDDRSLIAST